MIEVSHVSKRFGPRIALEDVSFYVEKGGDIRAGCDYR